MVSVAWEARSLAGVLVDFVFFVIKRGEYSFIFDIVGDIYISFEGIL